uniref:Uncharacterized protein n=1 Tax=Salix viminalis TaxID=40686 RepID=A0A6N2MVF8_SALVM
MDLSSVPPFMSLKPAHIAAFATTPVITVSFSGHMLMACLHKTVIDSPLLTQKIDSTWAIKFDINGDGDFTSVQEAINAVPQNDSQWIIIHIRKLRSLWSCEVFVITDMRVMEDDSGFVFVEIREDLWREFNFRLQKAIDADDFNLFLL